MSGDLTRCRHPSCQNASGVQLCRYHVGIWGSGEGSLELGLGSARVLLPQRRSDAGLVILSFRANTLDELRTELGSGG